MKIRMLVFILLGGIFLSTSAPAAFIDGYQDRRGFFVGGSIGGGNGTTTIDTGGDFDTIGFLFAGRIGGGVSRNFTLDAEFSAWFGEEEIMGLTLDRKEFDVIVNGNFFLGRDFYLRGGLGFAVGKLDLLGFGESQEGFAASGGLGYELFMNSNLAANINLAWKGHYYDDFNFNYFGIQVGLNYY